jgi:hypothetical protein
MSRSKLSRIELAAKRLFVLAVKALLLDLDAEAVGRIADDVGEYGTNGDGGAREDAVVLECLRVIVENHSGNEGRSVAFRGR